MDDWKLLRAFAKEASEPAFAELVRRYSSLVYSAALRQTHRPDLAEEVAQTVFIILARKAGSLSQRTILSGWLFRATRFAALDALKAEVRRKMREQTAMTASLGVESSQNPVEEERWREIAPLLDELMTKLREKDRLALILRFFERKTLEDVGQAVGLSKDGANKRVQRALEKLRKLFIRRGVVLGAAGLGTVLLTNAVQAAPVSLAPALTTIGVAKGAGAAAPVLALSRSTTSKLLFPKIRRAVQFGATALIAAAAFAVPWPKPAGLIDAGFAANRIDSGVQLTRVRALAIAPDGRVIVTGLFRAPGQTNVPRLVRLNPNGTVDFGFHAPISRTEVEALAIQPDGKILVAGNFGNPAATTGVHRVLIRLTPEGSVDSAFHPADATNGLARAVVLQPDGKIIVAGNFKGFGGTPHYAVARLQIDGRVDPTFRPVMWHRAFAFGVAADSQGRILVWGEFWAPNGRLYSLVRFLPDGALDDAFVQHTWNLGTLSCVSVQRDDKILVGVESSAALGDMVSGVVRLNADGAFDDNFRRMSTPGELRHRVGISDSILMRYNVTTIKETAGGKILIAGGFQMIHGVRRNGIARLNHDGSLDLSFDPGDGLSCRIGDAISITLPGSPAALETQPDGQCFVGGSFTHFDQRECVGLVRLLPVADNSLASRFWLIYAQRQRTAATAKRRRRRIGVRPSSGAATQDPAQIFDQSHALGDSDVAAAGDGRTPPKASRLAQILKDKIAPRSVNQENREQL